MYIILSDCIRYSQSGKTVKITKRSIFLVNRLRAKKGAMTLHFRRSPFDDVDGRKELKKEADMLDLECSSTSYVFFPTNLSKTFWLICSECLLPAFGNFIGK